MKRVVKNIDVLSNSETTEVHFFLFDKPKKVFRMFPARWKKIFEEAKKKSTDINQIADDIYHMTVLHFSQNEKGILQ